MNRRQWTCLLGLFLVTAVASVGAVGVSTGQQAAGAQPQSTPEEFDRTQFEITVYQNASARWTIQHTRPLNESQVQTFRDYAREFRQEETTTFVDFRNRARNLTAFGSEATGREMNATAFSKDAEVLQFGQRGAIRMSFLWTNFARQEGDGVVVGDVFQGGMYVGANQRLQFNRGPTLAFESVEPNPDSMAGQGDLASSESVTWTGEASFTDQKPSLVLQPREAVTGSGSDDGTLAAASGGDGGDGDAGGTGGTTPNQGDAGGMMPLLLAGGAVLLLLAGGLAWYSGYLPPTGGASTDAQSGDGDTTGASRDTVGAGAGAGAGSAATQVPDEDLLSDEDRVLTLLEDNGGRMKQVAIVEETEWSKSKVSMLLSDMEEEGHISKLRLGRENIISLAGQEPEAAGSPFEDE